MPSPAPLAADPRAGYTLGLEREQAARARQRRRLQAVIGARLVALVLLAVTAYEGCTRRGGYMVLALACLGLFVGLTIAIALLEAWREKQEARVRYFEEGLGRLDGQHPKDGPDGAPYASPDHPYAVDLDIFGKNSLFQRICAARTGAGQATLARWLSTAAAPPAIAARQAAVRELRDRTDLRKELWIAGGMIRGNVREDALAAWLATPVATATTLERGAVAGVGALGLGILYAFAYPAYLAPALGIFLLQRWLVRRYRDRIQAASSLAYQRAHELRVMAKVAELLTAETFTSPYLVQLRATVAAGDGLDRKAVAALIRRLDWLESRRNPVFGLFASILLLTEQLCFAVENWRARHAGAAQAWLATLAEVEALCSFATFAFEHPGYAFATVEERPGAPAFLARGLGHPLIPAATRVTNDLALTPACRLLVVTGSNMSGKSTLLRTVGVNVALSLAGAPACAAALTLSPVRLGASLCARDSLEEGVSRFFAEIQRLHAIVAMAKEEAAPVLFLLDEILNGTNSQDRHDGAAAVLRLLLAHGALGLVTTHDLSLASLGEGGDLPARNVHFQDRLEGDRLIFDYRMREGVVTRRNALDLMRLVGIDVAPAG